ncbi:TIGR02285 family protein [Terasakiella sp. A23]|uniref:TIGR02285 family protein n=1 Tax=Terasakiella sp. FCG-A23 TaxID=3080561 RepID=UPI002955B2EE|nr:TIGR02285 family protein [Terasakiella sp. A23]MDV7341834.1 TIGR02285 family protein [Terasakiella sp. A23]
MSTRSFLTYALLITGFLFPLPLKAYDISTDPDDTTLTWHKFQAPPFMILSGPDQNSGIIDGLRQLLKGGISGYTHTETSLPYKRFLLYAAEGMNICTPYLFKTAEREKFLYFSKPAVIFPGLELIMHKDTYERFEYENPLSLKDMFEKHAMRLATNNVRAYSKVIDPIVEKYEEHHLVGRHTGSTTLIFRLLTKGRADFMVDFPNRILYWSKELNVDPYDYLSIPIKEDYTNAISYVACPKTPWGKKVIDKVNAALAENVPTQTYLDIMKRWSPEYHFEEVEELYEKLKAIHE